MQTREIRAMNVVDYTQQVLQAYDDGFVPNFDSVEFTPRMIGFYFLAQFVKAEAPAVEAPVAAETTEVPKRTRKAKDSEPEATPEA